MQALQTRYAGFHQQMLTADGAAIDFYRALGFERAGKTEPMCQRTRRHNCPVSYLSLCRASAVDTG
jgi:ribosomal protein S18 acetylase RimI-like enzyme